MLRTLIFFLLSVYPLYIKATSVEKVKPVHQFKNDKSVKPKPIKIVKPSKSSKLVKLAKQAKPAKGIKQVKPFDFCPPILNKETKSCKGHLDYGIAEQLLLLHKTLGEKVPCLQKYETFQNFSRKEYLKQLKLLEDYMRDTSRIKSCKVMSADSGINLTYLVTYENGIKGILKYPSYEDMGPTGEMIKVQDSESIDKIYREAGASSIAKHLDFRSMAPIVATTYNNDKCLGVKKSEKVSISYFLEDAEHIKASEDHNKYYSEHVKHDWFNYLIFDCDHQFHNIMKKKGLEGKSYLFDHDWAFSNPNEVRGRVQKQPGFTDWCNSYIELVTYPGDIYSQQRADVLCQRYPFFKYDSSIKEKVQSLSRGEFPSDFPPLSQFRKDNLIIHAQNISYLVSLCKK